MSHLLIFWIIKYTLSRVIIVFHDPRDTIEVSGTRTNFQEIKADEIERTQPLRRAENETAHDDYEFYRRYQLGSPKGR